MVDTQVQSKLFQILSKLNKNQGRVHDSGFFCSALTSRADHSLQLLVAEDKTKSLKEKSLSLVVLFSLRSYLKFFFNVYQANLERDKLWQSLTLGILIIG